MYKCRGCKETCIFFVKLYHAVLWVELNARRSVGRATTRPADTIADVWSRVEDPLPARLHGGDPNFRLSAGVEGN